jgi:hypothetical protein
MARPSQPLSIEKQPPGLKAPEGIFLSTHKKIERMEKTYLSG